MICRGGLLWYHDIVVFPCRVQEKYEEVDVIFVKVEQCC